MSRIIRSHKSEKGVVVLIIVIIVLLICLAFFGLAFVNSHSDKITKGVTINNNVDVGGKTMEEAQIALNDYKKELEGKPYILRFEDRSVNFYGEDIGITVDSKAIQDAYDYGKNGNIIENGVIALQSLFGSTKDVKAIVSFDEKPLYDKVDALVASAGAKAVDSTYTINPNAENPSNIVIKKGHDGVVVKYSQLREDIQKNIESVDGASDIVVNADVERAKEIDIESLYQEIYVETRDAQISSTGEYTPEQEGIDFDKSKAVMEYRALPNDSSMTITLEKHEPEITTKNLEKILFADVLGTFSTKYVVANTNRSTNLALASNNINGTILLPGDEFSYNETVGERSVARGFKEAHVYSGGQVVDGLGGGICQISSTLYNAVLKADLEVTDRTNHMFWPEYVNPSFDATVAWGSIDFKFKNNRKSPIKIEASAKGGTATVTIYGKKEDDEPTISLEWVKLEEYAPTTINKEDNTMLEGQTKVTQSPVRGYKSEGYKIYKDIKGREIKRVKISTDTYRATNKIVAVGTKKAQTVTPDPEPITQQPVETDNPLTPVTPQPATTDTPVTPNPDNGNNGWPTGWDTPENPNYRG